MGFSTTTVSHQNESVMTGRDKLWYTILTVFYLASVIFFFSPWMSRQPWREQPAITAATLMITASCVAAAFGRWAILPLMKRPLRQDVSPNLRVAAATTYVRGNESLEMLEFTLQALANLTYPHDSWLLDEDDDPNAKALCAQYGVRHFSRLGMEQYQQDYGLYQRRTKYGNYNAWFSEIGFADYDVIATFDPDHVPYRDFLTETRGYFRDPRIGYVQAPQAYYNQPASVVAAGAAEETYDFNSTIQMASYGMAYPVIVGCHNVHRVRALRDAGGFNPHDADDLMLTMSYRNRQWRGVYVPRILARGMTPVDWNGYLTQQRRWARSVCDLKFRAQLRLSTELPFLTKVANHLQGLAYLQPGILFLPCVLALIVTIAKGQVPLAFEAIGIERPLALISVMTVCYLYRQQFFLDPGNESGLHWRSRLLRVAKGPALLQGILDVAFGRRFGYVMTSKAAPLRRARPLLLPFGVLAVALGIAWIFGALSHSRYDEEIHVLAALSLLFCLLLIASEFISYPPPFNQELLTRTLSTDSPYRTHS